MILSSSPRISLMPFGFAFICIVGKFIDWEVREEFIHTVARVLGNMWCWEYLESIREIFATLMENGTTLTFCGGQPGRTMIRKYLQKRNSSMSRLHVDKHKKKYLASQHFHRYVLRKQVWSNEMTLTSWLFWSSSHLFWFVYPVEKSV